jgi:solute carrier family 13 (sodium-dependent dicarboxylate transporter), member 2/3/5
MYHTYQKVGLLAGPLLFAFTLVFYPETMSPAMGKLAAIVVWMAVWWITEAIPIAATALLPIVLYPLLGIMSAASATFPYSNHLIFLFLGGFFIAVTMEKWNLHRRIALYTIFLVGIGPRRIILGFMIATAFLSMWISNTATAMMMLPIGLAVIHQAVDTLNQNRSSEEQIAPEHFNFGIALMLGIAYSASIGGVATIIGTPPNTILVGFIERNYGQTISFASWMALGLPLTTVMLLISWFYLVKIALPPEIKTLPGGRNLIIEGMHALGPMRKEEKRILFVFLGVAFCWILRGFINWEALDMVQDSSIAIGGALILFLIPVDFHRGQFLLDWSAAKKIPWGVILLFGGGFAVAEGFQVTGLADWIGQQLLFLQQSNTTIFIFIIVFLTIFLTEITSNTASAAMLVPIMGSIAVALTIHPYGLILAAGITTSYAFMLPVATPPNAVVFGSGYLNIPTMARVGFFLNLISTVLITLFIRFVMPWIWKIDLFFLPEWIKI